MKRFFRFFFKADYFYCTLVIFLSMFGISEVLDRFSFLNPIENALQDFTMTDIVFAENIREIPSPDTNIVLVNFGNLPRRGIARQIEYIAAQKPKVLGIDCSFKILKNPEEDSMLALAMSKVEKLVLYSKVSHKDEQEGSFDTLIRCHPMFAKYGKSGFCNLITPGQEKYKTCRTFVPIDYVKGVPEMAFGIQIAHLVDSNQANKYLARKNQVELINFRGNAEMFYSLDVDDFLGRTDHHGFFHEPEIPINLKDKIVLMGFMGENFGNASKLTTEDKFHTPMNPNFAGKAYPDMFGVVVHANIISMVLNDTPINQMSKLGGILLAIFLCYLNVVFFFYIHDYFPSWYDMVVKTVQVLEVFLILYIVIIIYGNYSYSIDITLAAVAIGFSGDILEVYTGAMYNIVGRFIQRARSFIKGRKENRGSKS